MNAPTLIGYRTYSFYTPDMGKRIAPVAYYVRGSGWTVNALKNGIVGPVNSGLTKARAFEIAARLACAMLEAK